MNVEDSTVLGAVFSFLAFSGATGTRPRIGEVVNPAVFQLALINSCFQRVSWVLPEGFVYCAVVKARGEGGQLTLKNVFRVQD